MSRWDLQDRDERDPDQKDRAAFTVSRGAAGTEAARHARRDRPLGGGRPSREPVYRPIAAQEVPLRELRSLLQTDGPIRLASGGHIYTLSARELRAIGTIGTFRAIPVDDLSDRRLLDDRELAALRRDGLVRLDAVGLRGDTRLVVTLTRSGHALLDDHAVAERDRPRQLFHAGLVKPAELAHDAELWALYEVVADDIRRHGGSVERVVLDYELKSDYQAFLNRPDRGHAPSLEADRAAWAEAHKLPLVDGELHLPDFRVEYRDSDGRPQHLDVEYATRHYTSKTVAQKMRAGFAIYRRPPGIGGAQQGRGGQAPHPHLFDRLI